jgi:hypothetical protein
VGNKNKSKDSGALSKVAQEKAQKNTEFGKMVNQSEEDPNIIHEEKPPSNNVGIDRGRWSE